MTENSTLGSGRLFVPLNTEPYRAFERGEKTIELRGYGPRFNEDTVWTGRRVELRRGYSTGDSIWGTVGSVWTTPMLTELPMLVDYHDIMPGATHTEFLDRAADLLGDYDRYIAFSVLVDESSLHTDSSRNGGFDED